MVVVGAEGRCIVGAGAGGAGELVGVVGVGVIGSVLSRLWRSRRRLAGFDVADW